MDGDESDCGFQDTRYRFDCRAYTESQLPLCSACAIATLGCGRIAMDSITWPVAALLLASITLVLSIVGNEIRRRHKFKRYYKKVVAELGLS
jgi:hypothetical protein